MAAKNGKIKFTASYFYSIYEQQKKIPNENWYFESITISLPHGGLLVRYNTNQSKLKKNMRYQIYLITAINWETFYATADLFNFRV